MLGKRGDELLPLEQQRFLSDMRLEARDNKLLIHAKAALLIRRCL